MTRVYDVISADGHIEAPPSLWVEHMPKAMRQMAPRIEKHPKGGDAIVIGDKPMPLGLTLTGGRPFKDFKSAGLSYDDQHPGAGGPAQRIKEQDMDGTDAEILFSALAASALKLVKDPKANCAIARAYNDWVSEYCSYAPDRLFAVAMMPTSGVEDAVAEARRVAGLRGIVGLNLHAFPNGGQQGSKADDAFWAVCEETNLCAVGHHNFGGESEGRTAHPTAGSDTQPLEIEGSPDADLPYFAYQLASHLPVPTLPIMTILQIILSGAFRRFPNLRFHFAETGIGWLPYWLEQIDDRYHRHRFWSDVKLPKLPSEYLREHFTFTFQEDHVGVRLRDLIGVDNICWASDFPHSVGDWPYSREVRERLFRGVPDEERRKIEALNVACQFGIISQEEKARQAKLPRTEPALLNVPRRWASRMPG